MADEEDDVEPLMEDQSLEDADSLTLPSDEDILNTELPPVHEGGQSLIKDTPKVPNQEKEIVQEALKLEPEELKKIPSALDNYKETLEQYRRLQEQRHKGDLVAGLAAAGAQIGQGFAGRASGQFKPDLTGYNVLQQMANRPVSDFEQNQIVQGRGMQLQGQTNSMDPDSQQSKLIRQYLNERLFKDNPLPDTVSAADAMLLMKTVGRPQTTHLSQLPMVNQQTGAKTMAIFNPTLGTFTDTAGNALGDGWVRDYRAQSFVDPATQERLSFSGGTGKVAGALTGPGVNRPGVPATNGENKPVELTRTMLTAQQAKEMDHTRDKFISEVKDDRNAINSADRVINVLDKGDQLGGDILGELRDQMSRAFGQKGHITDAQMGRILGREDWKSKFDNAISVAMTGKLDDENRQFLKDVMTAIRDQNQLFVTNKSKVYSNNLFNDFKMAPNLQKAHLTPDSINKLIGVEAAAASSGAPQKQVVKKGYNSKTDQTQLIYSDGTKEIVDGRR